MLWSDKIHFLDMFRTSLGVKNEVFPKSFGDVWAIIWHHRRCQRRGLKIFSKTFFPKKIKVVQIFFLYILAPELNSDLFSRAVLCIFRFFHIFHFFPPCRLLYTPFGTLCRQTVSSLTMYVQGSYGIRLKTFHAAIVCKTKCQLLGDVRQSHREG